MRRLNVESFPLAYSLEGAKELAGRILVKKDEWHQVYKEEAQ